MIKQMKKYAYFTYLLIIFSEKCLASTTIVETFSFTGADQNWTAPSGVTSFQFEVLGAKGGDVISGGHSSLQMAEAIISQE